MSANKSKIWLSAPHMGGEEQHFIQEAIDTNWVAPLGPNVNGFESDLQEFNGVKAAAALSSGTGALHLALRILGVERGDYILVQSFTFCGSTNPISYEGAIPLFIDSEEDTWNMSPEHLENCIKSIEERGELHKIKAVIPVHLYGMPAKMDEILSIAAKYEIPVIEDAAESLGSTYKGRFTGSIGRMAIYSFNGNKIITTSGGGALVSNDEALVQKARFLSTQAREPAVHYEHKEVGYNYRMSNLLAGVGRGQMKVLPMRVQQRRTVFNRYESYFRAWNTQGMNIILQPEPEGHYSNRWLTAIYMRPEENMGMTSETIRVALEEENIEARPLWKPMHMQPLYENGEFFGNGYCEELFANGLCLPSCSSMSDDDWSRITEVLDRLFKEYSSKVKTA